MRSLFALLFRKKFYDTIPGDDLMSRQRFTLFRIFSFTAFIASMFTTVQIPGFGLTVVLLYILSAILLINFFLIRKLELLSRAYSVSLIVGFLVVHIQAYKAGGIMNSGTIYMAVLILTAFMLLGAKAGKWFTGAAILNVGILYYLTQYTTYTSYELFGNDQLLIHQDALTTFILGLFLVAAQSNYLNSSKNVIIERITQQKDELAINNFKLQEYANSLEKTNRELDKFASVVSHDLKAPLRAIGNLTGWIEEDAADVLTGDVKANFELIKQRVRRMEDLIDAILEYSRADRRQTEDTMIDVKKLINETVDFIGLPGNVKVTIDPKMPVLTSDRTRLSQVFSNLIDNAIKYNDKPDKIVDVTCEEKSDGWIFTVKDNGPGIEQQYHEKIFIIFQTLNRRDDVESTGVGLAIVKKIIEDQGGKIWVESETGKGCEFKFFWPKVKKQKDPVLIAATMIV